MSSSIIPAGISGLANAAGQPGPDSASGVPAPDVLPAGVRAIPANPSPQAGAPALQTSSAPAVDPNSPHAGLRSMLQNLFLGMDAFGKSIATGGREGGAQEVEQVRERQAELKLAQQREGREASLADAQIKHTQAMTNATIAQTEVNKMNAPLEHQKLVIENQKGLYDLYVNLLHINPLFAVPIVQGQGTDEHMTALNAKANGDLVSHTVIPVHDEAVGGAGNTYGFSYDQLRRVNLPIEQAAPVLANLQNQIDLAKGVLPNGEKDPAIQAAQGKLDVLKKGATINGYDFFVFDNQVQAQILSRVANQKAIGEFQQKQADLQKTQQEVAAATRPKNVEDATSRATQAQIVYRDNPSPQTKKVLDDANMQVQELRRSQVSTAYAEAMARATAQKKVDEQTLKTVAHQMATDPNSTTVLQDIASLRGDERLRLYSMIKQENPSFDLGSVKNRLHFLEQFTNPNGKTMQNIASYNTFLEHAGDLMDVTANYRTTNVPVLNTPLNKIRGAFGDTTYTQFVAALNPVREEYTNFLKAGFAPHEEDIKAGQTILSDNSTPGQVEAAVKQMAHTAVRRADSINEEFRTVMGSDYPNLVTGNAKAGAQKVGLGELVNKYNTGGQVGKPGSGTTGTPEQKAFDPTKDFHPIKQPI